MTPESYWPIVIYAILFGVTMVAPIRWSLIAYFWLANVDVPDLGGGFSMLNILKAFFLPLYLLWRLRRSPGSVVGTSGGLLWIAFTLYVAIAGFWSLFPAAAVKFVGHLAGSLLICVVLVKAISARKLGVASTPMLAFGALTLAILRWLVAPDWGDSAGRFSSFVSGQSFAAFIAALYCILLFSRSVRHYTRIPLLSFLALAMILNGSRMWGTSIALATILAFMLSRINRHLKVLGAMALGVTLLGLLVFREPLLAVVASQSGNNRIADAITAFENGDEVGTGLGTLRFRRQINDLAIREIGDSSTSQLVFGHGTSNGATITSSLFKYYFAPGEVMDPNRMLHNEWLRVIYEWGIIGSLVWIGFISSVCTLAWKGFDQRLGEATKPLCVYLPGFLINLAGENILAGAGNVVNMGFLLVLALAYVSVQDRDRIGRRKPGSRSGGLGASESTSIERSGPPTRHTVVLPIADLMPHSLPSH